MNGQTLINTSQSEQGNVAVATSRLDSRARINNPADPPTPCIIVVLKEKSAP